MKNYTIPKGEHSSMTFPKLYLGYKKRFDLEVVFDDSCIYELDDAIDQLDINKLFGVSFGDHHKNSIRIGWNYNLSTKNIVIYYYVYEDGIRMYSEIDRVELNTKIKLAIELDTDNGDFTIHAPNCSCNRVYKYPDWLIGYYLNPYFGGNQVAPHEVVVKMNIK